jgi:cytochrome P450
MAGANRSEEPLVSSVPTFDIDLFSDESLRSPYENYRELREAGPVVYLPRAAAYAFPRYAEVRAALDDHDTYISGKGVGLSEFGNSSRRGTPIASDPPLHTLVRSIVQDRLSLRAVREITPSIKGKADELVGLILEREEFDGVSDFARQFPLLIMADLIGLPLDGREKILGWADAGFNLFGPDNERTRSSMSRFPEVVSYIRSLEQPGRLRPGSMGAAIYEAAEEGKLKFDQCGPLMVAYLMAGLDTTINAISAALMLFGKHPDQWESVRSNPKLLPTAFNEVIRLESPIQNLRRVLSRDAEVGGHVIPAGASVLMMFGSANRDDRKWVDPDRFDASRNPVGHVAFGMGIHNCPGQILARAETMALLDGLVKAVSRIEIGEPVWHLNNVIRGLEHLPVRLHA